MGWTAIRTDLLFGDMVFDDPGEGGAVGATQSVEEMMAGEGILPVVVRDWRGTGRQQGSREGMMPPMMSKGRRDLLDIY
jgi:hypothetical protein